MVNGRCQNGRIRRLSLGDDLFARIKSARIEAISLRSSVLLAMRGRCLGLYPDRPFPDAQDTKG